MKLTRCNNISNFVLD